MDKTTNTIPTDYVLDYYTSLCLHCGTKTSRSDFYARTYLRSRMGGGPLYCLPVVKRNTGERTTPYCCDCAEIDLAHLPPPPHAAHLHDLPGPALHDSLRPAAQRTKSTPKPAVKLSLKDIA